LCETSRVSKQRHLSALKNSALVAQRDRVPAVFDPTGAEQRRISIDEFHEMLTQPGTTKRRVDTDIQVVALRKDPSVSFGHAPEVEYGTIAKTLQGSVRHCNECFNDRNIGNEPSSEYLGSHRASDPVRG